MNPTNCLNCNKEIIESSKFCSQCGQNTHIHRFTLKHFFHEFFHAFTHTDKGIFHLLKCLAIRPGTTAREYIKGKRKKYFNPFTFFLILMTFFVVSNNFFEKSIAPRQPDVKVLNRIPTQEGKDKYITMLQRGNEATGFFKNHGNLVAMIAVPFFSLFTWLAFRKRKYNFAEHLTANMMFVAFSNLIFTIIIFPLAGYLGNGNMPTWVTPLALLLQAIYIGWALNGFLQLQSGWGKLKSFTLSFLIVILWGVFSMILIAIYIYRNMDFIKFFQQLGN